MAAQLTASALDGVLGDGYAVVDGVFPPDRAHQLLAEMKSLHADGRFEQHRFQFGKELFDKPSIFEIDAHGLSQQELLGLPAFSALFHGNEFASALNAALPELKLKEAGPASKTVKLQHNAGNGGCFPLHYDNPGRPSERRVTCLVYLNSEWAPGDGGELQLIPFLQPAVDIEPVFNRLVVFLSDCVLHRVLPAAAPRHCFTIWLDGEDVNGDSDVFLKSKHLQQPVADSAALFQATPLQRVVSRSVYREEYEQSLRDCMQDTPAARLMVRAHHLHVAQLDKHAALAGLITALRGLKPAAGGGGGDG